MNSLFIDTHLFDVVVILFNDGKIYNEEIIASQNNNSTLIMPTIERVVGDDNIDEIIVVNGPGSFTGVRLGVTIAKSMAYNLNIPIKTISALEVMALNVLDKEKFSVAFNDRNGYFVGEFKGNKPHTDYFYLSNQEYLMYQENNDVITDVTINYELVIEYLKTKHSENPHMVNPIYVKKIAVEK